MTIDDLDKKTQAGFKEVRAEMHNEFKNVRAEMAAGFGHAAADLEAGLQDVRTEIRAEIKSEGEITRRHFDLVAEQFKEYTGLLADGTARNTERLDDHERRITAIESER